jgi:hypothetical protein
MAFGVEQARQRVLDAMYAGNWEIVDDYLTRYAAAVRAEERSRAIGEAVDALRVCAGDEDDEPPRPARECIAAVERLR